MCHVGPCCQVLCSPSLNKQEASVANPLACPPAPSPAHCSNSAAISSGASGSVDRRWARARTCSRSSSACGTASQSASAQRRTQPRVHSHCTAMEQLWRQASLSSVSQVQQEGRTLPPLSSTPPLLSSPLPLCSGPTLRSLRMPLSGTTGSAWRASSSSVRADTCTGGADHARQGRAAAGEAYTGMSESRHASAAALPVRQGDSWTARPCRFQPHPSLLHPLPELTPPSASPTGNTSRAAATRHSAAR